MKVFSFVERAGALGFYDNYLRGDGTFGGARGLFQIRRKPDNSLHWIPSLEVVHNFLVVGSIPTFCRQPNPQVVTGLIFDETCVGFVSRKYPTPIFWRVHGVEINSHEFSFN